MKREIESTLIEWKSQTTHKPLIIRGARQVGKSHIIEQFGQEHFENIVTVNLDLFPEYKECFNSLDPKINLPQIEARSNSRIIPGKTLLFIDEIQESVQAIKALRYYKEIMPELHVISAGSLLEFTLNEESFSFPVGRVQFMYMQPLSFLEFLQAQNNKTAINYIQQANLKNLVPESVHNTLLDEVRKYFLIGGMPEAVSTYLQQQTFNECQSVLSSIIDTYERDFGKYATKAQYNHLKKVFEKIPSIIARSFKYVDISSEIKSREIKTALKQLNWAGLLNLVFSTSASGVPLHFHQNENRFKLLFVDIGLLQRANRIDINDIYQQELIQINRGMLAEQFVGQEILAYHPAYEQKNLYYWQRDKKGSMAEVDFVINLNNKVVPIEVKAGKTGTLKSLQQFMLEKKNSLGIRISEKPLSIDKNILSVPFYLVSQLQRLIDEIND